MGVALPNLLILLDKVDKRDGFDLSRDQRGTPSQP
jgi:hypothetical protein